MKTCRTCGYTKPMAEFYRHPLMRDGRLNACKACRRMYQRLRASDGYAAVNDRKRYERNPQRREAVRLKSERWRKQNPEKKRAQTAVHRAIKAGRLVRQPCEVCGRGAQAHHERYDRPLEVRWFCPRHHNLWHRVTIVTAELDRAIRLMGDSSDIPAVEEA